jgi:hypothetical protein
MSARATKTSPARAAEDEDAETRWLVLHGHFYQPPREDPWTEEIEGEESAAPFANWNERIHAECYRPNARSRILGAWRKVKRLFNNYAWLSFNFGPTLLNWMERQDPETLAEIVRADAESRARNRGHGNAIAQAYNHLIMPLADARDRETQIQWGLADFRRRFGREAEAMWLPETAADLATLGDLKRHGMKYAILSPFQAAAIETPDGGWRDVTGGRFPIEEAYLVETPEGALPVFFYHGELSSAISFQHLLRSSDTFASRLAEPLVASRMVSIATDGEIYGHHEPFGDMGLAYALSEHLSGQSGLVGARVRVTNYAAYLERFPPRLKARLQPDGSSWSCAHGVERWRSDCGCAINPGGSGNQKWRRPLREALDLVRDALRGVAESESGRALKDPWAARNAYIEVVLDNFHPERKADFAARHFKKGADPVIAWRILESQRNAMLMYTSCGWFFDDIGGIEPRQLMLYATRAIDALGPMAPAGVRERFVRKLKEARSNDPAAGDGARIFKSIAPSQLAARVRHLNQEILANFAGMKPHGRSRYHVSFEGEAFWQAESHVEEGGRAAYERLGIRLDGAANMGRGAARVTDVRTEAADRYAWIARFKPAPPETLVFEIGESFRWPGGDPRDKPWERIRPVVGERKGALALGVKDLFRSEARLILDTEMKAAVVELDGHLRSVIAAMTPVMDLAGALALSFPPPLVALLESLADFLWASYIRAARYDDAKRLEHRMERLGIELRRVEIAREVSESLDGRAAQLRREGLRGETFRAILETMRHLQENNIILDARRIQEAIYEILKSEGRALIGEILDKKEPALHENLLSLIEAAERLNLDVEEERILIEPFEKTIADDPRYWP